jgi:hypothetical protein
LQNLIKQIDEIKDTNKNNDKIEWAFTDTPEWQAVEKSLNEWLKESLYLNPDVCKILADKIDKLLNDPNLQLNDDIKNSLVSLLDFLKWILGDYDAIVVTSEVTVAPENEVLDDTPVSLEFLDSLTEDDLISLWDNENRSKIKKELIKEDNWKKYTIIKWKRFYIDDSWRQVYDHNNGNNLIIDSTGSINLWNKNCYLYYKIKYNEIYIYNWREEADVIKFSDWQSMRVYENKDGIFRSSNGIDVRTELGTWVYRFYSNNNSILTFGMNVANTEFIKVTTILSKIKDSKE